jgi:hypothetical protein
MSAATCFADLDRPPGWWRKEDQELRVLVSSPSPRLAELAQEELTARQKIRRSSLWIALPKPEPGPEPTAPRPLPLWARALNWLGLQLVMLANNARPKPQPQTTP